MRTLRRTDIHLGKRINFPIYDSTGKLLLLSRGSRIRDRRYLDSLFEMGACIDTTLRRREIEGYHPRQNTSDCVFLRSEEASRSLERVYRLILNENEKFPLGDHILGLAQEIVDIIKRDVDAALAAASINRETSYRAAQSYLGSVLTAILAPLVGIKKENYIPLVCASLTRDIGLLQLDNESKAHGELTPNQIKAVKTHTIKSVKILKKYSVTNTKWLSYVLDHHERLDGSGYPRGLKGDEVSSGASLLNLIDSYSAQVLPNAARRAKFPANAMRNLLENGERYHQGQIAILIRSLTKYPPGTIVEINDGTICIVRNRPKIKGTGHTVQNIYTPSGQPIIHSSCYSMINLDKQISRGVHIEKCRSATLLIRKLWIKSM